MKKIIVLALSVLFIGLALQSCGKYEEGPELSMISKKARLENRWVYWKVIQNDQDVTDTQMAFEPDFVWDIKKDGTWSKTSNSVISTGEWRLSEDKIEIFFKTDGQPDEEKFIILKLKNKELWLYEVISSQYTEFHFVSEDSL